MHRWLAAVSMAILAAGAAPGAGGSQAGMARSSYHEFPAFDVPATPAPLDRIAVVWHWFGGMDPPQDPRAILILVPGFLGGAEDFRYVGERLVTRLPWLQVWAVDRRNNLLENRCGMELAQRASSAPLAASYYLMGRDLPGCPRHADPDPGAWGAAPTEFEVSQQEAASLGMARWGIATAVEDLRRLVRFARERYPRARVFLGGHSLGGMTAQIYAAWRFGATADTAGWRTIDGLVLIDGGVDGMRWDPGLIGQYAAGRAAVNAGTVYWDVFPVAAPALGILAEIVGLAASFQPAEESFLWPRLPEPLGWPVAGTCPTNKALLGAFTDETGFHPDIRLHQGRPQAPVDLNGDQRPDTCAPPHETRLLLHWLDFDQTVPPELSSTDRFARALWQSRRTNAVEWYFSIMLNADIDLASNLDSTAPFNHPLTGQPTTAAALEGHRVLDQARVAVPVYAFVASECRDRFDWYRSVARAVPEMTIVDHSAETCAMPAGVPYAHLDPLFAEDEGTFTNAFIASVASWLSSRGGNR